MYFSQRVGASFTGRLLTANNYYKLEQQLSHPSVPLDTRTNPPPPLKLGLARYGS